MSPLNLPQNPFAISATFLPATSLPATSQTQTAELNPVTWWFVCQGSNLLVLPTEKKQAAAKATESWVVPQAVNAEALGLKPLRSQFLGHLSGQPCVAVEVATESGLPAGMDFQYLRSLHGQLREDLFAIAARAVQIIEWDRTHQFCGHCATPTMQLPTERAKRCPNCNFRQYPQLSPAVIMLIYKGDELLLARAPRFRAGMYSVLAGFVEPGESLEETVAREVREEVGVEIKNIRYFGSQPWPFPKSLMIGFIAEYASGVITPDPVEIEEASWFQKDSLPPVPGELSIARKLIDWFVTHG